MPPPNTPQSQAMNHDDTQPSALEKALSAHAGALYFISRHAGAIEWARRRPWGARAEFIAHLDAHRVAPGDIVIGTLPVHLAEQVCARRGRYIHLLINQSENSRGRELTADDLEAAGACLAPYKVTQEQDITQKTE